MTTVLVLVYYCSCQMRNLIPYPPIVTDWWYRQDAPQSANMARKEWLAGLIAYNLIRSVMAAAAAQAQISVHLLSFSRCRQLFLTWLLRWVVQPQEGQRWVQLLADMAQMRLPRRTKPRPPEPRAIRAFQKDFPKLEGDRAAARKKLKQANAKS